MYVSIEQVRQSLKAISNVHPFFGIAFLAFKLNDLPIGRACEINFSSVIDEILDAHYRLTREVDLYFQPLKTGNKKGRWVAKRYGSTTMQRITKDTFKAALIHTPQTSDWGWQTNYLDELEKSLGEKKIPAFHLAVWLFRDTAFPDGSTPENVRDRLFSDFHITDDEVRTLFNSEIPSRLANPWHREREIGEFELLDLVGYPPGYVPKEGVTLRKLELKNVGPATSFLYEPAERLNLITGDNGLGKTFILECVWWSLTDDWPGHQALPRPDAKEPRLSFRLAIGPHTLPETSCTFLRQSFKWERRQNDRYAAGIVIYSRFDGSFAVLDPARIVPEMPEGHKPPPLKFKRREIWDGLEQASPGSKFRKLCNGLIEDWVLWQRGGDRYEKQFSALASSLKLLSPTEEDNLVLGEPTRIAGDSREIPTLAMQYGDVPVTYASAGVQRIITLAYMLVWTWTEHIVNSNNLGQTPQRRLVLLIDEVEAHLHPRWQRALVPGIMQVVNHLWSDVSAQIHIGTHSPLVMASAEPIFDEENDDLHHLELKDGKVSLGELPFIKRGTVDAWLMSKAFGLGMPRSVQAEIAITDAKNLQLAEVVSAEDVRRVHRRLSNLLAEDDDFWPRWRFFALSHGVDE